MHDVLRPTRRRQWAVSLGILAGLLACSACSDDSGSSTGFDLRCLEFSAEGTAGPGTVVARNRPTPICGLLEIELVVTGVSDILGARFTLNYPFAIARLEGIDVDGSFLGSDGTLLVQHVEQETPADGVAAIVITRQATTGATPVPESSCAVVDPDCPDEVLVTLSFTQLVGVVAQGDLTFTDMSLEGPGTPPVPIDGVVWSGGEITVE